MKTFNNTVSFLFELSSKLLIIELFVLVTLSLGNLALLGLKWMLPAGLPSPKVAAQIALGRLLTALVWLKTHRRLAWLVGLALAAPLLVGLALTFPAGRSMLKAAWGLAVRLWTGSPRPAQWLAVESLPVVEEVTAPINGRH